jgi:hypothetical protein
MWGSAPHLYASSLAGALRVVHEAGLPQCDNMRHCHRDATRLSRKKSTCFSDQKTDSPAA